MTYRLKADYDINIGKKKVLDLMNKANALSAVRRRYYSEEYYLTRRQIKDNTPPDLIGRNFFALEP